MQKRLNPLQALIFPSDVPSGVLVEIVTGLLLVYPFHQWKEVLRHTLAQSLPWLITAFRLVWILECPFRADDADSLPSLSY